MNTPTMKAAPKKVFFAWLCWAALSCVVLAALVPLAACGIRPGSVEPPAEAQGNGYPRTYPDPSTDPSANPSPDQHPGF